MHLRMPRLDASCCAHPHVHKTTQTASCCVGKYTRVQHDIVLRKPANSDSKLAEFYLPPKTRPYTAEYAAPINHNKQQEGSMREQCTQPQPSASCKKAARTRVHDKLNQLSTQPQSITPDSREAVCVNKARSPNLVSGARRQLRDRGIALSPNPNQSQQAAGRQYT